MLPDLERYLSTLKTQDPSAAKYLMHAALDGTQIPSGPTRTILAKAGLVAACDAEDASAGTMLPELQKAVASHAELLGT